MLNHLSDEEINRRFKEQLERHERVRDTFRQIERDVGAKSIEAIRRWAFEVLTISSAILGVFVAIGSDSPMVKHKELLSYAFLCFTLTIVFGFYKLKKHMEEDLDEFPKFINRFCDSMTRIINAERQFYLERTEDSLNAMQQTTNTELKKMESGKPKEKRSYDFDIIFYLFFLGLVLIAYSIKYSFGSIMSIVLLGFFGRFCWEEVSYYRKARDKTL